MYVNSTAIDRKSVDLSWVLYSERVMSILLASCDNMKVIVYSVGVTKVVQLDNKSEGLCDESSSLFPSSCYR